MTATSGTPDAPAVPVPPTPAEMAGTAQLVVADQTSVMPVEHILQFFAYEHLPPHLRAVSEPFSAIAQHIMQRPRNPERTVALRKLLESKDAAVRAELAK